MHCAKASLIACAALSCIVSASNFNGERALNNTRYVVWLGPRPPGSAGIKNLHDAIHTQLGSCGCQVRDDVFTAQTPIGPVVMRNIIARFAGTSGRAVAITGHYDTKLLVNQKFVGANDGGSSTGFLLEMARALNGRAHKDEIFLVWFDGEESFGEWSTSDGLYGSRHLASVWAGDGTLNRLKALVNVDMIGDKDLGIMQEANSSPSLRRLVWQIAKDLGYAQYFLAAETAIDDDHMPFVQRKVNAIDLIDFEYGPNNIYWHNDEDTLDKLSAHSFQVVGDVLLELIHRLEK
jgi:glutaminyl-peptide cyclotransferase